MKAGKSRKNDSLLQPRPSFFGMIKLNLAHGNLARLSHLSRRVLDILSQQRQTRLARERSQRFRRFVSDHGAVRALLIDQDRFERGDGSGVFDLTKDVGEFVFEQRGGVGEACR